MQFNPLDSVSLSDEIISCGRLHMILAVDGMLKHCLLFLTQANIMNPEQTTTTDEQAANNCCGGGEKGKLTNKNYF